MLPLAGYRVVTTAVNVPGPFAAARLRGLGAEVAKIEPPGGDPLATMAPEWYRELAGEDVLSLDLKTDEGRVRLAELLSDADLLLTAQRPSALARLGLAWAELNVRFPQLSQVAIVGEPEPAQERPGHDLTYVAHRGLVAPPELPRTVMADLLGAERAATAAVAALLGRERGEPGTYIEVALGEAADTLAEPLRRGMTAPGGPIGGGFPGYGLYETRDGWIAVAALEPRFWSRLEELGSTRDELAARFREAPTENWIRWAGERDVPLVAVRRIGA
jgi:crotonobetainyl-CoA:carnitine CoA-transferase CaiB-like acyl-CoA transferase